MRVDSMNQYCRPGIDGNKAGSDRGDSPHYPTRCKLWAMVVGRWIAFLAAFFGWRGIKWL
jgi:hypothetical protein